MQRAEIDGVPVLWRQGPPPLRATPTFGDRSGIVLVRGDGVAPVHARVSSEPSYDRSELIPAGD